MPKKANENRKMRMLTALGIILIVAGHLNFDVLSFGGLFPYYSFHVFIFLFVSGYFYNSEDENEPVRFVIRKAKKLLLPYFIFNLLYGLLSTYLNGRGFSIGYDLSLKTLFLDPFLGGHQFMFNSPAWFVPALFVTELLNLLSRKLVRILTAVFKIPAGDDVTLYFCTAVWFILGIATVYLAIGGHVWGNWKMPGRWLIMMPALQLGSLYRQKLEGGFERLKERIGSKCFYPIMLGLVVLLQAVLLHVTSGLAVSVVWCTSFANGCVVPFVAMITGIAFYLILASLLSRVRAFDFLLCVGRESYDVMTNHLLILFIINSICFLIFKPENFDEVAYKSDIFYQYLYAGYHMTHFINTLLCVGLTTLFGMGREKCRLCDRARRIVSANGHFFTGKRKDVIK